MNARIQWVAFQTIVSKEIRRFMRIWIQTLVPPVITTSLYFIIFGNLIGPRIGLIGGHSYIQFIVPGLVMMAVITNAYANVCSSFFSMKFQKSIEEMIVAPVSNLTLILGFTLGGVLRALLVGLLVLGIALFFTNLTAFSFGYLFLFSFLTALLFSLGGFLNALYAKKFDDISVIPTFVLTPLTYLGGVFYSVEQLPPFWQGFSKLNPILYMISGFRYGFLGISDVDLGFAVGLLVFLSVALFVVNYRLLQKGTGLKA